MAISRSDRARQFLPFDALKGLQELLREKEEKNEDRIELSEDSCLELSKQFNRLEPGDNIKITYYNKSKYVSLTNQIFKIDYSKREIIFKDEIKVKIDDIIEIKTL